jgi:hypothetical protein
MNVSFGDNLGSADDDLGLLVWRVCWGSDQLLELFLSLKGLADSFS